ncbi:MAG: hypothetical protein CME43_03775 [Haliea sp.]|jgi:hypothetical protein|uniref:DUF6285 domain-containing protein n=1 Tax=Haliea sp. TaxID=1932666 RepID=UPI000C5717C2|nr:DUF6285 domain-containing protein [Haliea sp.]MBM68581.1 hypothetical protein [Haliea sp.]|tara:strand:- start:4633 stop:5064 length:432 start_codon:yes stop_codon:yes gene_type:complete
MSHTDAKELLAAVQGFLRQSVLPQLEGFDAYTTRVAANSLAIVSREIAARDDILELDREAGSRWLGPAAGASPDEENHPAARALSLALRDGRLQVSGAFIDYLRERTLRQMAIDNPRYSGFKQARQRWPELAAAAGLAEPSNS